jgi:hypothetical protein
MGGRRRSRAVVEDHLVPDPQRVLVAGGTLPTVPPDAMLAR